MRIAFELSINLLESFLILEFLAEYFGFRVLEPKKYYGFILLWLCSFGSVSFFHGNRDWRAGQSMHKFCSIFSFAHGS